MLNANSRTQQNLFRCPAIEVQFELFWCYGLISRRVKNTPFISTIPLKNWGIRILWNVLAGGSFFGGGGFFLVRGSRWRGHQWRKSTVGDSRSKDLFTCKENIKRWRDEHTSYLSREPWVYPCKFFLAGVNSYRFNAKNWHFWKILREKKGAFFTDLMRKIGVLRCKFYSPKILPV